MRTRRFVMAVAATALGLLAARAGAEEARRTAADYQLDGVRLGASFRADVMSKAAFANPCDDDPIDDGARTLVVYMGHECRGQTFPEGTTVLFYLARGEGEGRLAQPVQAIAWMGGGYFDSRSDFPARVGQAPAQVDSALGRPTSTFTLGGRRRSVTVRVHPGDVYSVAAGSRVVAFVVGQMPADHGLESWEALLEIIGESPGR